MRKMQRKTCIVCGERKQLDISFYKEVRNRDGYDGRCKECHLKASRERLRRSYDKDKGRKISIEKRRTGKSLLTTYRMMKKYPEKWKARTKLRSAVYAGKIVRGKCVVCGDTKVEGHHDDYSKPLDVKWMCMKHHKEYHYKPIK